MKETDYQMVEYSNHITTATTGLTAYELDVFLIIVYMARQKIPGALANQDNDLVINLPIKELKKILRETGNSSPKRIKEALMGVFDSKFLFKKDKYIVYHHLFKEMKIHTEKDELNFIIKKEYVDLFFNLTGNFTQHSILTFGSLKSKYAKKLYQIIMGYKHIGFEVDSDIFRTALEIPKGYQWAEIERILKPAIEELKEKTEIETFKMTKIKTGRKITKIKLEWTFENNKEKEDEETKEEEREVLIPEEVEEKKEELTEEEKAMIDYIEEVTGKRRPPIKESSPLYVLMMRGYIKNFAKGE